jgi:hypothetical protein
MPAAFGETLLRVYTREARYLSSNYSLCHLWTHCTSLRYLGIIQSGYRRVLENIPDRSSPVPEIPLEGSIALTPPPTEAPTTPRSQSRNASFSLAGTSDATPLGSSSKYLNNAFTTVPPTFAPPSPTRNKRAKGGKRQRDVVVESETPPKKKKE